MTRMVVRGALRPHRAVRALWRAIAYAAWFFGLVLAMGACMPAQSPVDAERFAVVATAEAVEQADQACAKIGLERKDVALLTACKDAYDVARPALVSAQYYLSIGDQHGVEASLCTGQKALAATAQAITATGAKLPPFVTETMQLAGSICTALGANNG